MTNQMYQANYQRDLDCRYNVCEIPLDEKVRFQITEQARSVACLVIKHHLVSQNDFYSLHPQVPTLAKKLIQDFTEDYRTENPDREPPRITYNGPFGDELSLAEGTAFVVSDKLVLTTAHNITFNGQRPLTAEEISKKIGRLYVVFGYQQISQNQTQTTFPHKDVYQIDAVWRYKYGENDDWALLKLNRKIENRPPLNAFSSSITLGTQLYMLGYPSGLPLKITMQGEVKNNTEAHFFETDLRAFVGNSGSLIFELSTQKIIGMHLSRHRDYILKSLGSQDKVIMPYNVGRADIEDTGYEKCHKIASVGFIKTVLASFFKMAHTHFFGRKKYLDQFKSLLAPSEQATVLLYGPGGIGKSELATYFANENLGAYSFIWQISCGTEEEQYLGYVKLAQRLKVPLIEKESVQDLINRVHRQLEQCVEKPWLLILDNVEKPFPLPAQGGSILITSRTQLDIPLVKPLEVLPMDLQEALELLTHITKRPADECQKLLNRVGCYPLVLGQVAAFIRQEGISIENYLKEYDKYHGVSTLETILQITLAKLPLKAGQWLFCCAYLYPDRIPVLYLESWLKDSDEDKAAILDALEHHALLRPSEDGESFSLHVELQKVLRSLAPPETLQQLVSLLVQQSKSWDFENTTNWLKTNKDAAIWACHAELLILAFQNSLPDNLDQAVILTSLGEQERNTGNCSKALTYHTQVLETRKKMLGDHVLTAESLSNMSITLVDLGRHEEALKYEMEALELRKTLLGPSHPDVADSLSNVSLTLGELGRHEEALKYGMEALELRKTLLGPSQPYVAQCLFNVSGTLGDLGRHEEALKYLMDALKLWKTLLGPSHDFVARSLNNVGLTLGDLGRHEEALKYLMDALELYKTLLGPSHPNVASSLENVGVALGSLVRYEEAFKYKMEALELRKTLLGPSHTDVASNLDNVGITLGDLGRHEEALKYLMEALELYKTLLGPSHPDVAQSLNNMGTSYFNRGNYAQALEYYTQALDIRQSVFKENHPLVVQARNNINLCKEQLNKKQNSTSQRVPESRPQLPNPPPQDEGCMII